MAWLAEDCRKGGGSRGGTAWRGLLPVEWPDVSVPEPGTGFRPPGTMRGEVMAEHPNVARIRDGYAAFAKGDFGVLTDLFADNIVWHVTGRNQLAGDYR